MSLCYGSVRKWLLLILAMFPVPIHAAEIDRCLPPDSQVVVTVNVPSILRSPLARGLNLARIQAALAPGEPGTVSLLSLGIDPLRDVSQIIYASPAGADPNRGLVILHGRFDPATFQARTSELTRTGALKLYQSGSSWLYEAAAFRIRSRQKEHTWIALVDPVTLVAGPAWGDVVVALEVAGGKRQQTLNRPMQDLIVRANPNQMIGVVEVGNGPLLRAAGNQRMARGLVEDIETVTGGLNAGNDLAGEFVLVFRDAGAARKFTWSVNVRLRELLLVMNVGGKSLPPALEDSVRTLHASIRDRTVVLHGQLSPAALELVLQKSL